MYDDFNNPANNGDFDQDQWVYWSDPPNQIAQQDGVLTIIQVDKPASDTALAPSKYPAFKPNSPILFEAKLMLDTEQHAGHVYLSLNTTLPSGELWWSACQIDSYSFDSSAAANCHDTAWQGESPRRTHNVKIKPVDYGTWHKFRIELDPAMMTFTYYIDDQIVGSHIPVDAEALKNAQFALLIGIWGSSSDPLIGYIDDVRIGPIGQ
jgi:hypothetical protein